MTKKLKTPSDQMEFDSKLLEEKRFTLQNLVRSKFNQLSAKIHELTHSDIIWLSRVEDFFIKNEYLTERQVSVLDSIIKRHTGTTGG